jgi:hypothetical protein
MSRKYTFVKLETQSGRPQGWYLKLTSQEAAIQRFEKVDAKRIAKGVWEFAQSREFGYVTGHNNFNDHLRSPIAHLAYMKAMTTTRDDYTILHIGNDLEQAWIAPRLKYIEKFGAIYVNKNGGWMVMVDDKHYKIVATADSETWPEYTKDDIHVSQWSQGSHWYARVGDQDVSEKGRDKWDSQSDAQAAAERRLAKLQA